MKTYQVNKEGYYGEFGGAYIPSTSYYATMWDALHLFTWQTG